MAAHLLGVECGGEGEKRLRQLLRSAAHAELALFSAGRWGASPLVALFDIERKVQRKSNVGNCNPR